MSEYQNALYFKEYPCYNFAILEPNAVKPLCHFQCNFEDSNRKVQVNPPAAIIDTLSRTDIMYLLQWRKDYSGVFLYLRRFEAENEWIVIRMNMFPDHIQICGGTIFLLASQELHILVPFPKQTYLVQLNRDFILSINPCLVQVTNQKQIKFQPGVYVLYFGDRQGYYAYQYSVSGKNARRKNILSSITGFFKAVTEKNPQFLYLQVIIPNIFALAFVKPNQICLFNLQTMELMPNLRATLIEGELRDQKPIIRWRLHSPIGVYEQTFLIMVGVGSIICSFYVMIRYNQQAISFDQHYRQPLTNFSSGSFISWPEVVIKPYLSYIIDGNILVDMQITAKGVVYYSKINSADLIGKYRYLQMSSKQGQPEHEILNQECTIWKYYYEDIKLENMAYVDRLLIPNRYSYSLVRHLIQRQQTTKLQQKMFNLWRHQYKFSLFLVFKDELLIARKGSLSVYRQINQPLFEWLNFSQEQREQFQNQKLSQKNYQKLKKSSQNDIQQQFQGPELSYISLRALRDRLYYEPSEQLDLRRINEINRKFRAALTLFQDIMLIQHEYSQPNLIIPQLKTEIICSKLRDKLCYFNLMFSPQIFILGRERERQSNKVFEKESFIIKLVQYFYNLYQRSSEFYNCFGHNLIDLFITKCSNSISLDIDTTVSTLLKKLFQNLLPNQVNNNSEYNIISSIIQPEVINQKLYFNPFLEFLVSQLKDCADQNKEKQQQLLRQQLQRFLNLGFFNNKSIYFTQFCKNKSLIKALFLSNSTQLLNNTFLSLLFMRNNMETMLLLYKQLKSYITNQNRTRIEIIMFFSQQNLVRKNNVNQTLSSQRNINRTIIQNHIFFSEKYNNFQFDLNQLTNQEFYFRQSQEEKEQQQNQSKTTSIHKFIKSIISKQLNTINFTKINNSSIIIDLIKQIQRNTNQQDQVLQLIEQIINQTHILKEEESLQYNQRVLIAFVDCFNSRVAHDSDLPYFESQRTDSEAANQFKKSRLSLSRILGCIKAKFSEYVGCFEQTYGRSTQNNVVKYEESLMSSTFLQKPLHLLKDSTGPILSSLSIQMVFKALNCQHMSIDEEYHNALTNFENLKHFWTKNLQQQNIYEGAYKQFVEQFNTRRPEQNIS